MVSQSLIDSIVERIYNDSCKVFRVIDMRGNFIAEFPVDINEDFPFDMRVLLDNLWDIFEVKIDPRKADMISSLPSSFWTCNCEKHFVRHIGDPICKACGIHLNEAKGRLPKLKLHKTNEKHQYITIH